MPCKCRYCAKEYTSYPQLKVHAEKQHPETFQRIRVWLQDDIDWRLESEEVQHE